MANLDECSTPLYQPKLWDKINEVDVLDAVLVINMILGLEPSNYTTADLNNDNQINVQDIILLINIILNN